MQIELLKHSTVHGDRDQSIITMMIMIIVIKIMIYINASLFICVINDTIPWLSCCNNKDSIDW